MKSHKDQLKNDFLTSSVADYRALKLILAAESLSWDIKLTVKSDCPEALRQNRPASLPQCVRSEILRTDGSTNQWLVGREWVEGGWFGLEKGS